jgi:endonuclease/exonuclease/phosphatase (EEP) superfamily protein YafD
MRETPTAAEGEPGVSPFARTVLYLVAWIGFVSAAVGLAARYLPVTGHISLLLAAFAPYLMLGAVVSAGLLLFTRKWGPAAAALLLVGASLWTQLPMVIGGQALSGVPIRVVTANVHQGRADSNALVTLGRDRADILILEELTPELAESLNSAALGSALRYQVLDARRGGAGMGIWSRYPIVHSVAIPDYRLGMISAVVDIPGAAPVTIVAVHMVGPWPQPIDDWRDEMARLPTTLSSIATAADERPVVVAGDFNATLDMAPLRRALGVTFRDAAEQSGAGFMPTYPADRALPLIGIDHVLTYQSSANDVRTVRIPGSDHLGLTATVDVAARAAHP